MVERGTRRTSGSDAFLSHAGVDEDRARRLARDLAALGVDVWLDKWEISAGARLEKQIEDALRTTRKVFVLVGTSGEPVSDWVRTEVELALDIEKSLHVDKIVPIVENVEGIPLRLRGRVYADMSAGYYSTLVRLVASVSEPQTSLETLDTSLAQETPMSLGDCHRMLTGMGINIWSVIDALDFNAMVRLGGEPDGDRLYARKLPPEALARLSPSLRELFTELEGGQRETVVRRDLGVRRAVGEVRRPTRMRDP